MPINNQSLNKELYKLLKVRGFDPIPKDSTGETSPVPDEADVFKFTFKQDGKAMGTAWATVDGDNNLTVYYGDDVTQNVSEDERMNDSFDLSWTGFLKHLKMWAQRKQMGFDLENKDHLHSDMAQREYSKKQESMIESRKANKKPIQGNDMNKVNEGYYPMGKAASYNDAIPTVKIILQHTRQIQEGEQRYRNIARIFLENTQGERFLAPTNKPGIAQIYARHLAEGGVPNDERWNHIKSLCEEYMKMSGFVRAVRNNQFNESAQKLINEGINHYQNLRESLSKMRGHRGYNAYFESWTPTLMENEGEENTLNELFVQETLDPRIESVMPILNKLSKNISEVKEVKELEEWANNLTEAPGAETLAHNQSTASSNLKAFDLEEQEVEESGLQAYLGNKKYGKEGMNALRKAGRDGASKEKMAKIRAKYDKLDEEGVAEGSDSNTQSYLDAFKSETDTMKPGTKKYVGRKDGKEVYAKKDAKGNVKFYHRDGIKGPLKGVAEDLDANQKRVGQLGPTEKVGPKGAVGKLVGANESIEHDPLKDIKRLLGK